ncbi:MAG: hypothetical protein RBU29_04500 [bacterium]|jgi:hypothetical protein|nr:hypothetical protein [bacterium]
MRKICLILFLLPLFTLASYSEDYTLIKVWEYLATEPSTMHPWHVAKIGNDWPHETATEMDFYSTLIRYDENRLLLFLIENGINEAEATAEQQAIAQKFPDRSLLWIHPNDGSFLGVALVVGLSPSENSEYYTQKVTGTHPDGPTSDRSWQIYDPWPQIAVDGDGFLYVSDKHKILRYKPDGNNGFTGPEVVFTYPEQDPPAWLGEMLGQQLTNQHYRAWIIRSLNVKGKGNNKVMTTAARFWIDGGGIMYYSSTDGGASWTIQTYLGQSNGPVGIGGTTSQPIEVPEFNEEWVFGTGFPGSSNRIWFGVRYLGSDSFFDVMPGDLFSPAADAADVPETQKYMAWEMIDIAAADTLPYVAVLSLPAWQSRESVDRQDATAWVALHSTMLDPNEDMIEGDLLSTYKINVTEKDELPTDNPDWDNWDAAYLASIKMYKNPAGYTEILWTQGTTGFGRLVVGEFADIPDWSLF